MRIDNIIIDMKSVWAFNEFYNKIDIDKINIDNFDIDEACKILNEACEHHGVEYYEDIEYYVKKFMHEYKLDEYTTKLIDSLVL